jgi:glycosyltransferase involved in cell wall biosynthesis
MNPRNSSDLGSVAIVHDYLNQRGGAERVVLEMTRMWPSAPIYTSLYRHGSVFPEFARADIRTTFADRVPLNAGFRLLAPVLPLAFHSLGVLDQNVVISSSSGWSHAVRTASASTHVVYCYAPARWLYSADQYFRPGIERQLTAPLTRVLRKWDRNAARRADVYIAIAGNVRDRVRSAYGIEAQVVYPPVDTRRFKVRPRGDRLLTISRFLPYKRVDLIISACNRLRMGLDVVGDGPLRRELQELAGPTVSFHGAVADDMLLELIEGCSAVCMPGIEDFGIVPLEGNAAGKPALAFAAGGALETIEDGVTGVLFATPTVESVVDALRRLDSIDTDPHTLAAAAERFSVERFRYELAAQVRHAVECHEDGATRTGAPARSRRQTCEEEAVLRAPNRGAPVARGSREEAQ